MRTNLNTAPKLVPSIYPRQVVRAGILGDLMTNFGFPTNVVQTAQAGFIAGDITGVTVRGIDRLGTTREMSVLLFDSLCPKDELQLDMSGGRSMTEALSRRFAQAMATSVHLMLRQGLRVDYTFHIAAHVSLDYTGRKYGLETRADIIDPSSGSSTADSMKRVLRASPGRDPGVVLSHYSKS